MPNTIFWVYLMLLSMVASPWCIKKTFNLNMNVDKVDYSKDGTYIVVTSIASNRVNVYDIATFNLQFTYSPTSGGARVSRFSRNDGHMAVGKDNGYVDLFTVVLSPFSATLVDTYEPLFG